MTTRCMRWIPLFGLLLVSGLAQQAEPPNRQITLDVVVTDKSGKPVPGLQQQDFTLLDNKQPQKILSFQAISGAASAAADQPTEVILLLDEVNDSFGNVSYEREQVEKFL